MKGKEIAIQVAYQGRPKKAAKAPWKGGFVWDKDKEGNDWIGVACQTDGASIWWPLKDHTSDEPDSMSLHYSVPKGLVAVGNGNLRGKDTSEHFDTYHWHVSYPINTYNVTLYAGNFVLLDETYMNPEGKRMDMHHYVLPNNLEKARDHFNQVHDIIAIFEKYFGPYPWFRDGFRLVESPYMGMEHQTAIAYGNGYSNDLAGGTDYIILHEAAHEWWGNGVTASDLGDVWLQEGFATYAEVVYLEEMVGKTVADDHLRWYRFFIKNKYPVVSPRDRRWFHFRKHGDVYTKGAWILHSLRNQMENDKLFFSILKSFSEDNMYGIVDSEDFVELVNAKSGSDYHWFFNHYLYTHQAPELHFAIDKQGNMRYRWANTHPDFKYLKIKVKDGEEQRIIIPSSDVQSIPLKNIEGFNAFMGFVDDKLFAVKESKELLKYNVQ